MIAGYKSITYDSPIVDPSSLDQMNYYGKKRIPFLFVIDYKGTAPFIAQLKDMPQTVLYDFNGFSNAANTPINKPALYFEKKPVPYDEYKLSFDYVQSHLAAGNSYLVNLTFPTLINTNYSLYQIFMLSNSPYKLLFHDQFVVFSPETFIAISNGYIYTYPMKGTIDESVDNAREKLLNDEKEFAEHITAVDLLRNDLSKVSYDVAVEQFRYCSTVHTHTKRLLQTSSTIRGTLYPNYHEHLGQLFAALLPAGSVTGAPKKKTVEIIQNAETYDRGCYSGVFGYFDGTHVVSAVMIRFIEKNAHSAIYKSGGGITVYSNPVDEYNEMAEKVYVPIN